jgi:hypothetical protein
MPHEVVMNVVHLSTVAVWIGSDIMQGLLRPILGAAMRFISVYFRDAWDWPVHFIIVLH